MIRSTRLLILLSAMLAAVSAMGWMGGGGPPRRGCEGDWPEDFPEEPADFQFRCRCPCKCRPKSSTPEASTLQSSTLSSTLAVTSPSSTASSTSSTVTTPSTTTISTTITTATTPSTSVSTSVSPSTSAITTPFTTVTTEPTNNPGELEDTGKGTFLKGQEIPVNDESNEGDTVGETGTTFWIRSPTPPNTPDPVVRGGAAFTVGPPQAHVVNILAPSAPDRALDPSAIPSGDLDFNFKTVGTPKPPRAVIDPDA